METREILEQQLKDLEAQKVTLFDSGSADQVEVGRLNEKIKGIQQQLSAIETQDIIYATAEEITSSMETFTVGDTTFTLEQLAVDGDAAKILRKGLQTTGGNQAQKFLDELNTQKEVYEQKLRDKDATIEQVSLERDKSQNDNSVLRIENINLSEENDSLTIRDAVSQQEIARLNSHVDDLRKEIAVGASNVHNVIDITSDAELEAAAQRLKAKKEQADQEKRAAKAAARIKVYNIQQLDGTGAMFGANRADNDEYITYGWLERANFIELSNEEASRFRTELEAAKEAAEADMESIPEDVEPVEVEETEFREPIPAPEIPTIQEHAVHGEVDAVAVEDGVTRSELEERLRQIKHEVKAELVMEYGLNRVGEAA